MTNLRTVQRFLDREIQSCQDNGIIVNLQDTEFLTFGEGLFTSGWFDEDSLQVAIRKPIGVWLPTFVHESCHKDQFLEKSPVWNTFVRDGEVDALELLDDWLAYKVELSDVELEEIITKAQTVEEDCERRTIRKIIEYNLPIDLSTYAKRANVYLWFYRTILITRKWLPAPYEKQPLLDLVPDRMVDNYKILPKHFIKTLVQCYPSG